MRKQLLNYDALLKVTRAMSMTKDPEEVVLLTVESIKTVMQVKGCTLFLFNKKSCELEVAASYGLSDEYINKGPVIAMKSIAKSLEDGPVAISDVSDDPRLQYPEAAEKEGIKSILSVPIVIGGSLIGAMRVYTDEYWEFTLEDVNIVQALAQMAGILIENARMYQGQKESIDILKKMRDAKKMLKTRRTPFEGVPVSVPASEWQKK